MIILKTEAHEDVLELALHHGMEILELDGSVEYLVYDGTKPVALMNLKEAHETFEPHLQYFPWATNRNKYRSFLEILGILRKQKHVIISTRTELSKWFDGWAKREKIKKVGIFEQMSFGELHLYQAVKCKS